MLKTLHRYPPETLDSLLDCGLDFAQQDLDGRTPLMCAARTIHLSYIPGLTALLGLSVLLERHVALGFGSTDPRGNNVLHLTAAVRSIGFALEERDGSAVLELLLTHPGVTTATANARYNDGHTPLHVALLCGNVDCASTLLGSPKVRRGDADNRGHTPLHSFLKPINTALIGLNDAHLDGLLWKLLRWRASSRKPAIDIFATDDDGRTALDLAFLLGDRFEGIRRTLECFMHWRGDQRARKRRRGS